VSVGVLMSDCILPSVVSVASTLCQLRSVQLTHTVLLSFSNISYLMLRNASAD